MSTDGQIPPTARREEANGAAPRAEGGNGVGRLQMLRVFLLRAAALLGAFVLLLGLLTALAGVYTSRPEFCRSCHNMEPYYVSWQVSSHSHVSCIKCHFAPGVAEKVRGKMLGLVQLAKYVTASEGPRPAAEIPDASCLRSGCHETRLLAGKVEFHGVPFDHRPHLEQPRRGKKLRCTSCHSQIVQGRHMTVTPSTCFLCHFKGEHFNQGLGTCTRCHQIPEEGFDLGGGAVFKHELAYERGVDCINCHSDLIQGKGEVPPERCSVCHNRQHDLERIDDHEFLHRKHVSEHKVDCLECHLEIHHTLDPHKLEHAAANCASCHPNHHQEQVKLLKGEGAKTIRHGSSGMVGARIACPACHRVKEGSPTGTILWKASIRICSGCHDSSMVEQFQAEYESLKASLSALEVSASAVREALGAGKLDAKEQSELLSQLEEIQSDLEFLRVGNGIHNIHYANTVTRALVEKLGALCRKLKIEEPQVTLPQRPEAAE